MSEGRANLLIFTAWDYAALAGIITKALVRP